MNICEQCGYTDPAWCMSCTSVTLEEYISNHNILFHTSRIAEQKIKNSVLPNFTDRMSEANTRKLVIVNKKLKVYNINIVSEF